MSGEWFRMVEEEEDEYEVSILQVIVIKIELQE